MSSNFVYHRDSPQDFQRKMRQKVKGVLQIDITHEMPLGAPIKLEYDIVISRL